MGKVDLGVVSLALLRVLGRDGDFRVRQKPPMGEALAIIQSREAVPVYAVAGELAVVVHRLQYLQRVAIDLKVVLVLRVPILNNIVPLT